MTEPETFVKLRLAFILLPKIPKSNTNIVMNKWDIGVSIQLRGMCGEGLLKNFMRLFIAMQRR